MAHTEVAKNDTRRTYARVGSVVTLLLGLGLAIAPFVLGYSVIQAAMWNDVIVGLLIAAISLVMVLRPIGTDKLGLANAALGVWLSISPWILRYPTMDHPNASNTSAWTDHMIGIAVIFIAGWSALQSRKAERRPPR